ncbi:hypothetical protein LCGC14_3109510, partial [marine sediment metagenome]
MLGSPVFSALPVTLDYRGRCMTFHARDAFRPPVDAAAAPMQVRGGKPIAKVRINETYEALFVLDTGSAAAITFAPGWAEHFGIDLSSGHTTTTTGAGGQERRLVARVGRVELFGRRFSNVPARAVPGGKRKQGSRVAGEIGGALLR